MRDQHPAITAHLESIACAQRGEKQNWLSLFDDSATVHDPVGPSPHDPQGIGFTGRSRLEEFWNTMIGPSNMQVVSHKQIASGPRDCVCIATATNKLSEDLSIDIEMIVAYQVNDSGLITSLKAYWDLQAVAQSLKH